MDHARTHYDLLGLPPDASAAQIRRAFADAARRAHPDRRPVAERADAEAEMARLNEAWRVLRDPDRRAAYDVTVGLAPHPESPVATVPSPTGERGAAPGRPTPGDRPAAPRSSARAAMVVPEPIGCGPGVWLGAGIVVVLLLVGAVVAYVATVPEPDPTAPTTTIAESTYRVGSCVVLSPSASGLVATEVTCGGPSSGRIEAVVGYPAPCPSGTTEAALVAERTTLCLVSP